MGELDVTEFLTLDGVGQAPGRPDEDRDGGFAHGGWQAPMAAEETGRDVYEHARAMDALLLGRKTYDIFAGYWPTAPESSPFTALLNDLPKYVVSRTLAAPPRWRGSTLLTGDLAADVAELKAGHDHVHVIGSLQLVQSLLRLGLVDRLTLWLYPIVLGGGKRLFAEGSVPVALHLEETTVYSNGALQLRYETSGVPTYGTMAAET